MKEHRFYKMSWYVRRLLLDKDNIRESMNVVKESSSGIYLDDTFDDLNTYYGNKLLYYDSFDFDSDMYLDLLTVEKKLEELIDKNLITKSEFKVLELVLSNKTISQIERDDSISRPTVMKKFYDICNRIAYHLGDYFTDDGFITYISDKYNLTDKQIEKLKNYISEEK